MRSYSGRNVERDLHKHKHVHQDLLQRGQKAHHHTESWFVIVLIAIPVMAILGIVIYTLITR